MSEKEAIEWLKDISNFSTYDLVYVEALLQLLEQKDKRIDELEKALVEEDLKHREWRNSMSEEEKKAIKMCRLLLNGDITLHIINDDGGTAYAGSVNKTYNDDLETVLNLIEKQQIKIKELEADLYSANCTINEYIEERNKLKDKMIGDKMEQLDDYVIYLIESYLEIMGE